MTCALYAGIILGVSPDLAFSTEETLQPVRSFSAFLKLPAFARQDRPTRTRPKLN